MTEEKYKITGTVHRVGEMQTVGSKGTFTKRELVLETGDKYKQLIGLEFHKDKCSLLEGMQIGDTVTAHFNLNGRAWNDKIFNTLSVWKVELVEEATRQDESQPTPPNQDYKGDSEEDTIPF